GSEAPGCLRISPAGPTAVSTFPGHGAGVPGPGNRTDRTRRARSLL
ncbi:MAG: hypothetical protein AVDCRST_MAG59-967, partial [uncultured Thermomicrobiales bacterium]